ncbi:MAG: class I SAM-dependent methyltransferase [Planctomycetota bacterium]|jgi:ubiquinone/menaquinone biosynthesis C-methylase UbiE
MDQEGAIRLHYDTFAKEYDGIDQGVERVLSRLKIAPRSDILDVGCGTGNLTLRLPEMNSFRRVVGIDISDGVLDVARKHARDLRLRNFEFLRASACRLPFNDEEFDCVVSNMVFHLVPDQAKALAEIVRVLKSSGSAVLQFLGGGGVAPEMSRIIGDSWNKILPEKDPPNLFYRMTVAMAKVYLTGLGIDRFEMAWCRDVMKIKGPDVPRFLEFFKLVGYFWQWGVSKEAAKRVKDLITREVKSKAASTGYFSNTVNVLLIEFTKP